MTVAAGAVGTGDDDLAGWMGGAVHERRFWRYLALEVGIFPGHLWMNCFFFFGCLFLHLKVGFDFFPQGAMVKQGFMMHIE